MKLNNRNIVITGGTRGIGRELVRILAGRNSLAVLARDSEALTALAREHTRVLPVSVDLADPNLLGSAADQIAAHFPHIDVLINNAALQFTPTLRDPAFCDRHVMAEVAVNLTAPCLLTQRLLPQLAGADESVVANVNSGLALAPKSNAAMYCASKAGLDAFSRALRNQLDGTGVRVYQAFLPLVDTDMTRGRGSGKLASARAASSIVRGIEQGRLDHDIGKVRLLRAIKRLSPALAARIMRNA